MRTAESRLETVLRTNRLGRRVVETSLCSVLLLGDWTDDTSVLWA